VRSEITQLTLATLATSATSSTLTVRTNRCNMGSEIEEEGVKSGAEADGAENAEPDPPGAPHQVSFVLLKVLQQK
jgi:hypothetical protein